jgi:FAD/FMN-containing dehydrogenase
MQVPQDMENIVGTGNVLTGDAAAPFLTDWRSIFKANAFCVVRPGKAEEVARIVRYCADRYIAVVPQGGNTGLVGGATPSTDRKAVVLSTIRMNRIRQIDLASDTVTVEAGCLLQSLQEYCKKNGRLFPLSLGAEGTCTVGGNLATNAGGSQVLRYGNMRDLTLGLEVVTADGEIWNGLRALRKDNTGYDIKSLMVGSEGTLGIITAAVLKVFPLPRAQLTAFVAAGGIADCVALFQRLRLEIGADLSAFEVMAQSCLALVTATFPKQRLPLDIPSASVGWCALIEMAAADNEASSRERLEAALAEAIEAGEIEDAVIAANLSQRRDLWHLRESITLAQAQAGKGVKHDISLPISRIAEFVTTASKTLGDAFPGIAIMPFGHLGDGNLHFNVSASSKFGNDEVERSHDRIYQLVHDAVHARGGSISAEHGIGQLKRDELVRYKAANELAMMRAVKAALDPHNILNPGKVVRM